MLGYINRESIMTKVLLSQKAREAAFDKTNAKVERAKARLLEEFDNDIVTQELLDGPEKESSAILPEGYGNLYSFLGFFKEAENPVLEVRRLLETIHLVKKPEKVVGGWSFRVSVPSKEYIYSKTPLPFESGRSWISAISYGLGGYSSYVFSLKAGRFKGSRSGTGIQISPVYRPGVHLTGRRYVLGMVHDFKRRIR